MISDPHEKTCPNCRKGALYQVISPPTVFIKGEATTLGQLSERNTAKMGRYELSDKRGKQEEGNLKKQSWVEKSGNATQSEIKKMTKNQKARYIQDGKK